MKGLVSGHEPGERVAVYYRSVGIGIGVAFLPEL
jgi:hypothetical protein